MRDAILALLLGVALVLTLEHQSASARDMSQPSALAVQSLDLSIVVSGPAQARYRDETAVTVTVANGGPDAARDVGVLLWLPAEFRASLPVLGASAWACEVVDAGRPAPKVVCTLPSLAAGASSQFAISFRVSNVPAGTAIHTRGVVGNGVVDVNWGNDVSDLLTMVIP